MKSLFKRLLAIVAAMVMVLGMSVPAMAASITINSGSSSTTGSAETTTYTYYQLLEATISGDNVAYSITNDAQNKGKTLADLLAAVTYTNSNNKTVTPFSIAESADKTKYVVTVSSDVQDDDGALLAAALNTDAIKAAALATNTFSQTTPGGSAKADNLANGYYLITSSLGTALVAQTIGDVTITEKNTYPTVTKTVDGGERSRHQINVPYTYTITISVPTTAKVGDTITFHDRHSAKIHDYYGENGYTTTAKIVDPNASEGAEGTTITVPTNTSSTHNQGKNNAGATENEDIIGSITLTNEMLGKNIVITYQAVITNKSAADDSNTAATNNLSNTVYIVYEDYTSVDSQVKVKTADFDLTKTFAGSTEKDENLSATFQLRTDASQESTAISFVTKDGGYIVADYNNTTGTSTDIIAKDDVVTNITGLGAGTYYLVETNTAAGYNRLTNAITVVVEGEEVTLTNGDTSYKDAITIENQAGTVLPSTGGIGTTIFYIVGGVLVLGAVVLLVARRRKNA